MKFIKYLLIILICTVCISCGEYDYDVPPDENTPSDIVSSDIPYNEAPDNLGDADPKDLSELKTAIDAITNNYAVKSVVFFNRLTVKRVNINLDTNFFCQQTTLVNSNYLYRYTRDFVINDAYFNLDNNIYKVGLEGNNIYEKINSTVDLSEKELVQENNNCIDNFFTLDELNSNYIDTYGPTKVQYTPTFSVDYLGWTRISKNKYKCDRVEVINDFMEICMPGYSNIGTYLTFSHVTVELNPDNENVLRLRIYTDYGQIGKLIQSHKEESKPQWYLLIAEAYISSVNSVNVDALDKLYN